MVDEDIIVSNEYNKNTIAQSLYDENNTLDEVLLVSMSKE